jgi:hypothetical protein
MTRTLGYRDAVTLLGGDPKALAAIDRALGGALSLATSGASDAVLSLVDAQGRILRLGRDVASRLRDRLAGAGRVDRTRRLEAARAVLVVTAYFEALADAGLPFPLARLELTALDQLRLAGGAPDAAGFAITLLTAAPPTPAPHLPPERLYESLHQWYGQLSARLVAFVGGLAVWDDLDDVQRRTVESALGPRLCGDAVERYREQYRQLAIEVPEFGFWTGQIEHQATRGDVRRALAGVETLLGALSAAARGADVPQALATAHRSALSRPILTDGDAPAGARMPTLEEGYLDPDFRVRAVTGDGGPAEESWWADVPVRSDLIEYLAGALTVPGAGSAPLVVLGQPGAGKSVLTRVLAARLPAAEFFVVRVALREVPADVDLQDQLEHAVRAVTGRRVQWPDLVSSAGGALPVLLLDGFDELLQVTGVSQSDYLVRVAAFQQREADQGRPVVAVVTSRSAVADRARYPPGTVALRLEPFRPRQVDQWLDVWNRHNSDYLAGRGLVALPGSVVARHLPLATQPLLLLLLALYDADGNDLQRRSTDHPLGETELYERLLSLFVRREVAKDATLSEAVVAGRVEQEIQRLSLVAFGMLNRRQQWLTINELDADLAALQERPSAELTTLRTPLTEADLTLGRFFFVQRAQAVRDSVPSRTYEFLHATFGEYLAARLAVQVATSLLVRRPALSIVATPLDDDLLYALLSFAPLSSRQSLRFVRGCCALQVAETDRTRLADLLRRLLVASALRVEPRFSGYRPAALPVSARHSLYHANLVLLILALAGEVHATELFPQAADPADAWQRMALLWRSALDEAEWIDLVLSLRVRRTWRDDRRDLQIMLTDEAPDMPVPLDPYWLYGYPPTHQNRGDVLWSRAPWSWIPHQVDVAGGTVEAVVRHALDPVLERLGAAVTAFVGHGGSATSAAHDLVDLWLTSALDADRAALAAAYGRCAIMVARWPERETGSRARLLTVVLSSLRVDAPVLPANLVIGLLQDAADLVDDHPRLAELLRDCAGSALAGGPLNGSDRALLAKLLGSTGGHGHPPPGP